MHYYLAITYKYLSLIYIYFINLYIKESEKEIHLNIYSI